MSTANRFDLTTLPEEIVLNIIDGLGNDEILRLRQFSHALPEWLHVLLTDKVLYRALKNYQIHSTRPPLSHFDNTPIGRLDLKQREMMILQHSEDYPHGQTHKKLPGLQVDRREVDEHFQIHGPFVAFAALENEDTGVVVLMDLLNQKIITLPVTGYVRAITLTDTLLAYADHGELHVGRLLDFDFDSGVAQMRHEELTVFSLAGKHNQIAVDGYLYNRNQSIPRSVRIYDSTTHTMSKKVADFAWDFFWDEELWIITAEVTDKLLLTFESTRTVVVSADRLHGEITNFKVQTTGDKLQVRITWSSIAESSYQVLILDKFQVVDSFEETCTVWRGKRYVTEEGVGIRVGRDKTLGRLERNYATYLSMVINDTFLVIVSNDCWDDRAVVVVTMSFDPSIDSQFDMDEEVSNLRYWWHSAKDWSVNRRPMLSSIEEPGVCAYVVED